MAVEDAACSEVLLVAEAIGRSHGECCDWCETKHSDDGPDEEDAETVLVVADADAKANKMAKDVATVVEMLLS